MSLHPDVEDGDLVLWRPALTFRMAADEGPTPHLGILRHAGDDVRGWL
jgi:hypothetical protein